MCNVDDDYSVTLANQVQTARKPHRCGECGRTIRPGEQYRRYAGVYDGSAFSAKTCSHCEVGADWLIATCSGYRFHEVREELVEHYREGYNDRAIAKVIYGMRRKWQFRRGGLMPIPPAPKPGDHP